MRGDRAFVVRAAVSRQVPMVVLDGPAQAARSVREAGRPSPVRQARESCMRLSRDCSRIQTSGTPAAMRLVRSSAERSSTQPPLWA